MWADYGARKEFKWTWKHSLARFVTCSLLLVLC